MRKISVAICMTLVLMISFCITGCTDQDTPNSNSSSDVENAIAQTIGDIAQQFKNRLDDAAEKITASITEA